MKAVSVLARAFIDRQPRGAVARLAEGDPRAGAALLSRCSAESTAEVIRAMESRPAALVLARLTPERLTSVLPELPVGTTVRMLRSLPPDESREILDLVPRDIAEALRRALDHPRETVGSVMDPLVASIPAEWSAGEVKDWLRRGRGRSHGFLYVVDSRHSLLGALSLGRLMAAPSSTPIATLMTTPVVSLRSRTTLDAALTHRAWLDFHSLPVVDSDGTLVGLLPYSTVQRLRLERLHASRDPRPGSLGLELTELAWSLTIGVVDEVMSTAGHSAGGTLDHVSANNHGGTP